MTSKLCGTIKTFIIGYTAAASGLRACSAGQARPVCYSINECTIFAAFNIKYSYENRARYLRTVTYGKKLWF